MRYVEGQVTAVDGGMATVEVGVAEGGCGRCHEVGGCGSQNLARALCHKKRSIVVADTLGVAVGDRVEVGMEDAVISKMATRFYVVPLIGVLVGAVGGQALVSDGFGGVIGAVVGLAVALVHSARQATGEVAAAKMVRHGASAEVDRV